MDQASIITHHARNGTPLDYNITTNGGRERFVVPRHTLGLFYSSYCKSLKDVLVSYEQPKPSKNAGVLSLCGIMERAGSNIPIVMNLTLKFTDEPESIYDDNFVKEMVCNIQHCMYERYNFDDVEDASNTLTCIIAETKDGFLLTEGRNIYYAYQLRFYFPFVKVEAKSIDGLMQNVCNRMRSKNVLGVLEQSPVGDWREIFNAHINNPIPLYGSSERPEYPPVILEHAYTDISDCCDNEEDISSIESLDINDVFDIHEHALVLTGQVQVELFNGFSNEDLLPFFLSVSYTENTIPMRDTLSTPNMSTPQNKACIGDHHSLIHFKTDKEMTTDLLGLISNDHYYNKLRWLDIGKAIHTTYRGSDEGLSVWIDFTVRAMKKTKFPVPHFEQTTYTQACADSYTDFPEPTNVTMKTLAWFAKEDNPEGYASWHNIWALPYRQQSLDLCSDSLAKALYCELWLTHACHARGKTKTVYIFDNNRWIRGEDGWGIRNSISDEFKRAFENERGELGEQIARTNDIREKDSLEATHSILCNIIRMLKTRQTKSTLLAEVLDRITIPRFEELLDKNGSLTGHPNGVTDSDMETGYIGFRKGKPEDYISRTTKAKFDTTLNWDSIRVKEFMEWMKEMFIDDDTRHFVMKLFASGYVAGNFDKIGPFFSGNVNNGKSTLSNFLIRCWGALAVKFPTTGITRGYSDSGAPNPAMVRISGPRWGLADEPDSKEKLHSGPFKRVFGNDDYYNRGLYSDGGDLENTCTVTVWANRIPPFPDADAACRIRFCCIPCLTTYVKSGAPESREEQFSQRVMPLRKSFQTQVNRLTSAALWVWAQYFPIWCKESLDHHPPEIEKATTDYWKENDIYLMYISDRIEMTADIKDTLSVTQIYKNFEEWFNMFNKGEIVPDRPTLRYQLVQHWERSPIANCWSGIKLKEDSASDISDQMTRELQNATVTRETNVFSSPMNKSNEVTPESSRASMIIPQIGQGSVPPSGINPNILDNSKIPMESMEGKNIRVEIVDGKLITKHIEDDELVSLTTIPCK
jgi:hypothetical protein